ncbi:hypothetical protein SCB29_30645 [Paraburkholderia sp. SIMBA_055]
MDVQIPVTDEMANLEKIYDALMLVGSIALLVSIISIVPLTPYALSAE